MRQAPCASRANAKIVIGPNTGVYVGGLPLNFEIRRSSKDPRMKVLYHMSCNMRKPVFGVTGSDTNQAVQPHRMVRGLKFRI